MSRLGVSRLGVSRLGVSRLGVSRLGVSRLGVSPVPRLKQTRVPYHKSKPRPAFCCLGRTFEKRRPNASSVGT